MGHGIRRRQGMVRVVGLVMVVVHHLAGGPAAVEALTPAAGLPNIVYILADDLGYGDVACLNVERGKIPTPHIDGLAAGGMVFTDAHSGSAVCTPTRYGILTGRYSWRSTLAKGVLWGYSPPLLATERMTVGDMLKKHGYHTAAFGKWHLGLGMTTTDGAAARGNGSNVDFAKPLTDGPTTHGFDVFDGISASLDMPPFVYIENDRFAAVPTTQKHFVRRGLASEDFEAVEVMDRITLKTVQYIEDRAKARVAGDGSPFFIYMPLSAPHGPVVPTPRFQGKSGLNKYADFVMQVDDTVGRVIAALERGGLTANTLMIVTSDNGCSPVAKIGELEAMGHYPNHVFRGHKADIFEGGHRVPFIAHWPARIQAGSTYDHTICLTDLMATAAEMVGAKLPDDAGEDSVSILPALLGQTTRPLREATVHHSINGSFSIRRAQWKLNLCPGSGGWSAPRPGSEEARRLPGVQLYDMTADIGEQRNLQAEHPEVVAELRALLQGYVDRGRSTPGTPQANDREVRIDPPKPPVRKKQAAKKNAE